jgi:sugar phosphate isomerase/epimerase
MRFGVCVDWKKEGNLQIAKAGGAEYVELNFQSFINETPESIAALGEKLQALGLDLVAYNCMLPGSMRVTGEQKDFAAARDYLEQQLAKLQALPARTVVFGSGAARMLDGENTKENGMRELAEFLRDYLAPVFEKYGFTCVVEPLSECNFLRTMQDGLSLVQAVDRKCVRLLAGFYHIAKCGESLVGYEVYAPYLYHTHIAALEGRSYPKAGDPDDYPAVFRALRAAGYDGCLSLEAGGPLTEEGLRESFACLSTAANL